MTGDEGDLLLAAEIFLHGPVRHSSTHVDRIDIGPGSVRRVAQTLGTCSEPEIADLRHAVARFRAHPEGRTRDGAIEAVTAAAAARPPVLKGN